MAATVVLAVSAERLFIDDAYLYVVDGGRMIDRRGTIREDRTKIFNIISAANLAFEWSSVTPPAIDGRNPTKYRSGEPG